MNLWIMCNEYACLSKINKTNKTRIFPLPHMQIIKDLVPGLKKYIKVYYTLINTFLDNILHVNLY